VLDRLARGERTAEIAYSLQLKPETVNAHILRIRKKLGAKTNAHAVALWLGYHPSKKPQAKCGAVAPIWLGPSCSG